MDHSLPPEPSPLDYPFPRCGAESPQSLYAMLRSERPVAPIKLQDGSRGFVVTRYSDARRVLQDPRFSRAALSRTDGTEMVRWAPSRPASGETGHTPPYRLAAQEALSPQAVERLRPQSRETARELLKHMLRHQSSADLISSFARPLPLAIVGDLIGLPEESRDWVADRVPAATAHIPTSDSRTAIGELTDFITSLMTERRSVRRDDLISRLLDAQEADSPKTVTDEQLRRLVLLLCLGGLHTVTLTIGKGVPLLLRHADLYKSLAGGTADTEKLVEEVLRLTCISPSSAPRLALEDVQVGETLIPRGSIVLVCLESANQDETRFPKPACLNPAQASRQHTTFGLGANLCVGASLARMQLQEAFTALAQQVPSLQLDIAVTDIPYRPHQGELLAPDILALPVTWSAA